MSVRLKQDDLFFMDPFILPPVTVNPDIHQLRIGVD